jgi:hypothetical protein
MININESLLSKEVGKIRRSLRGTKTEGEQATLLQK